jgi:hypothetical protein
MIAFAIALIWLTLTAAGFHALTALGRVEPGSDVEPGLGSPEGGMFVSSDSPIYVRSTAVTALPR